LESKIIFQASVLGFHGGFPGVDILGGIFYGLFGVGRPHLGEENTVSGVDPGVAKK